ncbi:hypothetical protein MSAN_00562600 [Mycena sanguinolenta]|uniref:SRPBCC domain-containing protein n=1 Tax=Mycena sanguinolenta TaxID=230812 RepID=A0A8H6Z9X4_9AGAR|nr:hypothetical protein MSAN_00562600 [Mycena sanguinolenta]
MATPPLASSGVFTVADSILIDAPREKVWEILLDFKGYKEWNAFVRGQTLVSASGAALPDQTPAANTLMRISPVHLPPTMGEPSLGGSATTLVQITAVDHENFRAAWVTATPYMPRWALFAERWQMLTVVDGKTKYESIEVFSGILAYVVRFFVGANLVLGVRAMAEGLKRRAEGA